MIGGYVYYIFHRVSPHANILRPCRAFNIEQFKKKLFYILEALKGRCMLAWGETL
jgi:hypothetical protein